MATILDIPAMSWEELNDLPNGTEIKNHNYSECVAVANQYHQGVLGLRLPSGFGHAREWWTRRAEKPEIYENYTFSQAPAPGALFVARGGIYDAASGHIGVITAVVPGGFMTLEQNTGTGQRRYLYRYLRTQDPNILGFLIPNRNPATSTPAGQEEENTMKYAIRYVEDGWDKVKVFHPESGWEFDYTTKDTKFNNKMMSMFGFKDIVGVDKSVYNKIGESLAAVRQGK